MLMSTQNFVKPTADTFAQAARLTKGKGPAPVHLWNPPFCGDLDMRISKDGTWFYLGTPIGRKSLVKLFSNVLKKEGDDYFLVTPVEKVGITVDDAPFVATDFEVSDNKASQELIFTTHVGESFPANEDHPIRFEHDQKTGEPRPYILVRTNLEALIDRKSFYRLVELGETRSLEDEDWFGISSGGAFFPMIPSKDLG